MSDILQASHITQSAMCKICGSTIGHFVLTWPEPKGQQPSSFNQAEFGRLFKAITQHMQQRSGSVPDPKNQHQQALGLSMLTGSNLTQIFLSRYFALPEAASAYAETLRGSVNAMTTKFKLTREMARTLAKAMAINLDQYTGGNKALAENEQVMGEIETAYLSLAARYEEGHPAADPTPN